MKKLVLAGVSLLAVGLLISASLTSVVGVDTIKGFQNYKCLDVVRAIPHYRESVFKNIACRINGTCDMDNGPYGLFIPIGATTLLGDLIAMFGTLCNCELLFIIGYMIFYSFQKHPTRILNIICLSPEMHPNITSKGLLGSVPVQGNDIIVGFTGLAVCNPDLNQVHLSGFALAVKGAGGLHE